MPSADWKVEIVDSSGDADYSVSVVGDQVVDISGASPGDVLVVAPDGETLVTAPSATPGAHAASHAAAGSDPVTLAQSQITGLTTDLAALVPKSLFDANTILAATTDDTPVALTVAASTFVGRKSTGGIVALTATEAKAVLAIAESDVTNLTSDLALKAPLASPVFTGVVRVAAGAVGAPAIIFDAADTDTGFYWLSDNNLGVATSGTLRWRWGTAGVVLGDPYDFIAGTSTGTKIGTATNQKIAFHNATPVIQRAGAAQAAVATTGSALASFGYTTAAQADAIVTLVNELRAALVEKGLIKGAA